jgi:YEATS family
VRGAQNEDLSVYVKRVIFTLHPSFEQSVRILETPPYEVTESGWGEFEVSIKLVFRDTGEKPIEVSHMLRLYPPPENAALSYSRKAPLFTEVYDEVIFSQPRPNLALLLDKHPYTAAVGPHPLATPASGTLCCDLIDAWCSLYSSIVVCASVGWTLGCCCVCSSLSCSFNRIQLLHSLSLSLSLSLAPNL